MSGFSLLESDIATSVDEAVFKKGDSVLAPAGAVEHSHILRDSQFIEAWIGLAQLWSDTNHVFPGSVKFKEHFSKMSQQLSPESLELLTHIWHFCADHSNGSQLRFQDVLFLSFCVRISQFAFCVFLGDVPRGPDVGSL